MCWYAKEDGEDLSGGVGKSCQMECKVGLSGEWRTSSSVVVDEINV